MAAPPHGFRDISTTYQLAYMTNDGNVQVRKIGERLWEILSRGGVARDGVSFYEMGKDAALKLARRLVGRRKTKSRRVPKAKRRAKRRS